MGLMGTENKVYLQGGWQPVSPYIVSKLKFLKNSWLFITHTLSVGQNQVFLGQKRLENDYKFA